MADVAEEWRDPCPVCETSGAAFDWKGYVFTCPACNGDGLIGPHGCDAE